MSDKPICWFTDWISDVIIGRANSSYLKVTFDVKSRTVKWYAVELWDRQDNLIKSEKTEKVTIYKKVIKIVAYNLMLAIDLEKGDIFVRDFCLCDIKQNNSLVPWKHNK